MAGWPDREIGTGKEMFLIIRYNCFYGITSANTSKLKALSKTFMLLVGGSCFTIVCVIY